MLAEERRQKIFDTIEEHQFISVNQLADIFGVHETTIRRDLDELEIHGMVSRIHGGVVPVVIKREEAVFDEREAESIDEKIKIAEAALKMIQDNECIILDSGTTTLQIALKIADSNSFQKLTIVTNDINIAAVLRKVRHVTTIVTGGVLYPNSFMLNGQLTNEALGKLNVDKVFIATPALDIETGLNHFDELLISAKVNMIKAAKNKIVVVDSSKIGQRALYSFLPINQIDVLITDNKIEPLLIEELRVRGLKRIESV